MVVRDLRHSGLQAHSVSLLLRRLWAPQLRLSRARVLEPALCLPFLVELNAMESIFVLCRRDVFHARNGWNGVEIEKVCQCVVNDRVWVRESYSWRSLEVLSMFVLFAFPSLGRQIRCFALLSLLVLPAILRVYRRLLIS
jgi:hypothetical protein